MPNSSQAARSASRASCTFCRISSGVRPSVTRPGTSGLVTVYTPPGFGSKCRRIDTICELDIFGSLQRMCRLVTLSLKYIRRQNGGQTTLHQIFGLTVKDLKSLFRDRGGMIMLFAMPIMFIPVMSGALQNAFQTGSCDRPLVIITLATGAAATGLGLLSIWT